EVRRARYGGTDRDPLGGPRAGVPVREGERHLTAGRHGAGHRGPRDLELGFTRGGHTDRRDADVDRAPHRVEAGIDDCELVRARAGHVDEAGQRIGGDAGRTGGTGIEPMTVWSEVLILETVLDSEFVTKARAPFEVKATSKGSVPTGMLATTALSTTRSTETRASLAQATYTKPPLGVIARPSGRRPTPTSVTRRSSVVRNTLTVLREEFVTYTNAPLGVTSRSVGVNGGSVASGSSWMVLATLLLAVEMMLMVSDTLLAT